MPTINVTGSPSPGGRGGKPAGGAIPPGMTGPRSEVPWLRGDYEKAWQAHQAAMKGMAPKSTDYDRARRQQDAQLRQQAEADRRRRRQEEAMLREKQRTERAQAAERDRQTAKEMRERERERARDEMASKRLYSLGSRARPDAPLSASAFRSLQRQIDLYRREFPDRRTATTMMAMEMGSTGGAYARSTIGRLGSAGARAAEVGSYKELQRIEKLLQNIDRSSAGLLRDERHGTPSERADAMRARAAVADARSRITAGRAIGGGTIGHRAFRSMANAGHGRLMSLLGATSLGSIAGPAAEGLLSFLPESLMAGVEGFGIAEAIPAATAGISTLLSGASGQYVRFLKGSAEVARRSGMSANNLKGVLYNGAVGSSWLRGLAGGVSSEDALSILQNYGAPISSPRAAQDIVSQVVQAQYAPGMGLSRGEVTNYARGLAQIGLVRPGAEGIGLQEQFRKLGEVMTIATAKGYSHSEVAQQTLNVLQSAAASGSMSLSSSRVAELIGSALATGLPSLRNGGAQQIMSGWNAAAGTLGVGGSTSRNLIFSEYLNKMGGAPTSLGGLQKLLGMGSGEFQKMMAQPGSQDMWRSYLSAEHAGSPLALNYLAQFTRGNPQLGRRIIDQLFPNAPDYIKTQIGATFMGTNYQGFFATNPKYARMTAGLRNNNPLNLAYAGQPGAIGFDQLSDEKVATFASMDAGVAADYAQILRDQGRAGGRITIRQLINQWSKGRNNAAYVARVASETGFNPDQPLNFADASVARRVMRSMSNFENGGAFIEAGAFQRGIDLYNGQLAAPTGNVPYAANKLEAQTANQQLLASQHVYGNLARPYSEVNDSLGGLSNVVVRRTSDLEGALGHLVGTIEEAAKKLGWGGTAAPRHFGGGPGIQVAPVK